MMLGRTPPKSTSFLKKIAFAVQNLIAPKPAPSGLLPESCGVATPSAAAAAHNDFPAPVAAALQAALPPVLVPVAQHQQAGAAPATVTPSVKTPLVSTPVVAATSAVAPVESITITAQQVVDALRTMPERKAPKRAAATTAMRQPQPKAPTAKTATKTVSKTPTKTSAKTATKPSKQAARKAASTKKATVASSGKKSAATKSAPTKSGTKAAAGKSTPATTKPSKSTSAKSNMKKKTGKK